MTDREKLIELIGATHYGNNSVGENFQEGFIAKIADNLIANGVTIPVRCKDCKHFAETKGKDSGKPCGYGKCMKPFFIQMIVDADDFCSYGERRTE